jgi:hypothetical protein
MRASQFLRQVGTECRSAVLGGAMLTKRDFDPFSGDGI